MSSGLRWSRLAYRSPRSAGRANIGEWDVPIPATTRAMFRGPRSLVRAFPHPHNYHLFPIGSTRIVRGEKTVRDGNIGCTLWAMALTSDDTRPDPPTASQCPVTGSDFDPNSPDLWADPFGAYAQMRAAC